jgi:hypothetical protein
MTRLTAFVRGNAIAMAALFLTLGGGYAFAATTHKTKTITVCANKKTGDLFLHQRGRCKRGQTRVTWNQKGPRGPQGRPGASGAAGASAISVWAVVSNDGAVFSGHGLSVQHVSAGTYQVTVTAAGCAQGFNAPTVSVSDSNPPNGQSAGTFPEIWVGDNGNNEQFTGNTGVVAGGSFTPTDHTFNVQDACS